MPTSIAHLFAGMAAAEVTPDAPIRPRWTDWKLLLFAGVAANLPDADFLPGVLVGNPVLFHRTASHSLLAAAVFALLCGAIAAWRGADFRRWFTFALLVYGSHLACDVIAATPSASSGVPLFWPLDHARWYLSLPLPKPLATLLDLDLDKKANAGFFHTLLSLHGLGVFLGHALLFAPLPVIARIVRIARERSAARRETGRLRPSRARITRLEVDPEES